jgi:hypothetical protein
MAKARFGQLAEKIVAAATSLDPFSKALEEAIKLHKQLNGAAAASAFDLRHKRASAAGTLAAALPLAGSDAKKLAALEQRLRDVDEHPQIDRLIAGVVAGYANTTTERGHVCFVEPPAAATIGTTLSLGRDGLAALRAECRDWETSVAECIAYAIKLAGEQYPNVWGGADDAARAKLEERLQELYATLNNPPAEQTQVQWIAKEKSVARIVYAAASTVGVGEGGAALVAYLSHGQG